MRTPSTNQEDYLVRVIQQAGIALRMLRDKLLGRTESPEVIRERAGQAIGMLLGSHGDMLERVDARTAVQLLGSTAHAELWAALLDLQADAAGNDEPFAARTRNRAASIREAARSGA